MANRTQSNITARIEQPCGDWIVYYEPRRTTGDGKGSRGRSAYFSTAHIDRIERDPTREGHYYAFVSHYLDFDRPVSFTEGGHYFERQLEKGDGTTNKGAFGRAVRPISDAEYDAILQAGFAHVLGRVDRIRVGSDVPESPASRIRGFGEPAQAPFESGGVDRAVVQSLTARLFRDRAFASAVKSAYGDSCAVTGLKIINGGGRSEVQAAHIRPVADRGPDGVRNGLALSGTVHWMFDRGLLSVDDDYSLLIAKDRVPETVTRLLLPDRHLRVPTNPALRPAPQFLRYHRERVFKG